MKKGLLSILAGALLVVGCQNYDDQFDSLESQISALASTVAGLSQVQSDLSSLAGTVSSLSSTVASLGSTIDTAVANGLADITADITALQAAVANVASSADVTAISDAVAAAQTDLDELLANSSVFQGSVTINSIATLDAFHAMGSGLNIVNGNVTFNVSADMDITKVQAVVDNILNITGDLSYTGASTIAAPTFLNLSGVQSLTMDAAGDYRFDNLVTAANISLNNDNTSKIGIVHFGKLKNYTKLSDDAGVSGVLNFSNATEFHLTSLERAVGNKLNITIKKGGVVAMGSITGKDIDGKVVKMDIDLNGPASFTNGNIVDGDINLTNVKTASISGFYGDITIGTGVENLTTTKAVKLTISAADDLTTASIDLALDYDPALTTAAAATTAQTVSFASQDLVTASVTGFAGTITADGQNNLESLTVKVTGGNDLVVQNNTDLTSLVVTGSTFNDVTVDNNDNLGSLVLDHTSKTSTTDAGVTVSIDGNGDLTSLTFSADKVDNLSVQNNSDLSTVDFTGLATVGGSTATVAIDNNNLTASLAKDSYNAAAAADAGSYTSASGLVTLQKYLDAAVAIPTATGVKVFFDKIEAYQTQSSATAAFVDQSVPSNTYADSIYAVAFVTKNTADPGKIATKGMVAWTIADGAGDTVQITVAGVDLLAGDAGLTYSSSKLVLSGNNTTDIAAIKAAAHTTRATNQGVTLDAKTGGESTGTVSIIQWASGGSTATVLGQRYTSSTALVAAVSSTNHGIDSDDIITFTVGTNTVTTSVVSSAQTPNDVAVAILAAWASKYGTSGTASASAVATITNASGIITVTALDLGSRGDGLNMDMSIAASSTGVTTTNGKSLDWKIGATRDESDDATKGTSLVVTIESVAAGTVLDATDNSAVVVTPAETTTALAAATYLINGTDTGKGTQTAQTEARDDVRTAEDSISAGTNNASTTDRTGWLG